MCHRKSLRICITLISADVDTPTSGRFLQDLTVRSTRTLAPAFPPHCPSICCVIEWMGIDYGGNEGKGVGRRWLGVRRNERISRTFSWNSEKRKDKKKRKADKGGKIIFVAALIGLLSIIIWRECVCKRERQEERERVTVLDLVIKSV